ncbi:MAG: tetratricopeptide repeat protein, partial [Chitinivibrionales bacterium]|nr:tetratricopeptide repeat protein [Chitinivibrionales bacterium]
MHAFKYLLFITTDVIVSFSGRCSVAYPHFFSRCISFKRSILTLFIFVFLSKPILSANESESVFNLAERFYRDSFYNAALEQYQKYLDIKKRAPENDPGAYFKIAYCQYKMDNASQAATSFEKFIELFPRNDKIMEAMFLAGVTRKATGDYKQASDWFYGVWSRFVGSAKAQEALYEAARCAEKDKNTDRAIELYDVYFRRFPRNKISGNVALSLAGLLIENKEYSRAKKVLSKAEKRTSPDKTFPARLSYYKAILARNMQKNDKAAGYFAEMYEKHEGFFPEFEEAYKVYLTFLNNRKAYKASLPVYKRLASFYEKKNIDLSTGFLLSWAENSRKAKEYTTAEELYRKILLAAPSHSLKVTINYRIAECQAGRNDITQAIATLQNLAIIDSAGEYGTMAWLKAGDLYYGRELYPSAIMAYRKYLQAPGAPNKDKVLYRIAKTYEEKYQRYGAALREFENLLKLYPSSHYSHRATFSLARCHAELKDYKAAIRHYEYLLESGAEKDLIDEAEKHIRYLKVFKITDPDAAMQALTELMEVPAESLPQWKRLHRTAAIYALHLKQYDKALDIYDKLSAANPAPPASALPEITFHRASVYRNLFEKSDYDNDQAAADYAKEKAETLYKEILERFGSSPYADDAAFQIMMLGKPDISSCEQFLSTYPESKYQAEVLLTLARHYD